MNGSFPGKDSLEYWKCVFRGNQEGELFFGTVTGKDSWEYWKFSRRKCVLCVCVWKLLQVRKVYHLNETTHKHLKTIVSSSWCCNYSFLYTIDFHQFD